MIIADVFATLLRHAGLQKAPKGAFPFLNSDTAKPANTLSAPSIALSLEDAAAKVCVQLLAEALPDQVSGLREHFKTQHSVPPEFDRKLIARVAALQAGRKLTGDEMRGVRGVLVNYVRSTAA